MLKKVYIFFVAAVLVSGPGSAVMALSIGGSFNAGMGNHMWYNAPFGGGQGSSFFGFKKNSSHSNLGGSLAIDKKDPGKKYIHRIEIGMDRYKLKFSHTQDIMRLNLTNTFGYVLTGNKHYDLWLGPHIGVHYLFGNTKFKGFDNRYLAAASDPIMHLYLRENYGSIRYNMIGLDLGAALGINIYIKELVTLSVSGGVKYGAAIGVFGFNKSGIFNEKGTVVYNHGLEQFMNVSVLFRLPEKKSEAPTEKSIENL